MRLDRERHDLARPLCRPRVRRAGGFQAARRRGGDELGEVLLRMGATGGLHRPNDGDAVPIEMQIRGRRNRRRRRDQQDQVAAHRHCNGIANPERRRRAADVRIDARLACLVEVFRPHMQRLMDVADEVREQPDRFGVGEVDVGPGGRGFTLQLGDRVSDHLHDVDVFRTGTVGDVARLLQRHIGEVELVMVRIARRVRFLFLGGRAAAKRHVVLFRAIREHRDLAQTSLRHGAAVVLLQQFAHALLRCWVMLLQDQVGDGADDAMPRIVPCRSRHRHRACRQGGEACRSNSASHVRIPSQVASVTRSRSCNIRLRKIGWPAAAGRDSRAASCLRSPAGTDRAAAIPAPRARRNRRARREGRGT